MNRTTSNRAPLWVSLPLVMVVDAGCAQLKPLRSGTLNEPGRLVEEAPPAPAPETGSLWTEGSASLFSDPTARRRGDLLTILIVEEAASAKNARTATRRDASASAGISALAGLPAMAVNSFPGLSPSELVGAQTGTSFLGQGDTVRSGSFTARVTAVVEEVLPNGNLVIRGSRSVRVNGEVEKIMLTGIVRTQDVRPDNTVVSTTIADAKISYTGSGVLSEKQRVGWLLRAMDWVWPF